VAREPRPPPAPVSPTPRPAPPRGARLGRACVCSSRRDSILAYSRIRATLRRGPSRANHDVRDLHAIPIGIAYPYGTLQYDRIIIYIYPIITSTPRRDPGPRPPRDRTPRETVQVYRTTPHADRIDDRTTTTLDTRDTGPRARPRAATRRRHAPGPDPSPSIRPRAERADDQRSQNVEQHQWWHRGHPHDHGARRNLESTRGTHTRCGDENGREVRGC
jgi:hypothetical protein